MKTKQQDQKGLCKDTSLQAWSKLTEKYFHRKLRIEERKDREHIYSLLKEMKLPYERFHVFMGDKINRDGFFKGCC